MNVQEGSYSCFCHAVKEKNVKISSNQNDTANEDFDFSNYTGNNSDFNFEISQTEIVEFFYSNNNNSDLENTLENIGGEDFKLKLLDIQNALDYLRLVFMQLSALSKIKDLMINILT